MAFNKNSRRLRIKQGIRKKNFRYRFQTSFICVQKVTRVSMHNWSMTLKDIRLRMHLPKNWELSVISM